MSKLKILIIYSWDDFISKNRWRIISKSPKTTNYDVSQCFALTHEGEQTSIEQLLKRLTADITKQSAE